MKLYGITYYEGSTRGPFYYNLLRLEQGEPVTPYMRNKGKWCINNTNIHVRINQKTGLLESKKLKLRKIDLGNGVLLPEQNYKQGKLI